MGCEYFEHNGMVFHIRTSGRGSGQKCRYCDRSATRLCDFETGESATCDAPMCDYCTHKADRTTDFCPQHRQTDAPSPRRDPNAPRWMKAIYAGRCRACASQVRVGERMLWFKQERFLYCEQCGELSKTV
jgi:hypothetical protein